MAYHFLKLAVKVMASGVSLYVEQIKLLPTYLAYEIALVAYEVVGGEPVAKPAFGVGVVLAEPRGHVAARVEMSAVNVLEFLNLSARYAADVASGHGVSETDVEREHAVELFHEVWFLSCHCFCATAFAVNLFVSPFDIVWHGLFKFSLHQR